jgi:hypothetical protein
VKSALIPALAIVAFTAMAQVTPAPPPADPNTPVENTTEAADTPNRAVARISNINGVVSVRRGDSGEAVAAALNAPLTGTDRLLTGEGSRAEIQFDAANMIRLAPMTEVRLGELAYRQYQIQIATGTATFRVMRDNDAQIEISTPSVSVRPMKRGTYRITVKPDGTSEITVRSGEAEISTPKGTEKLGSGKTMEARGTADSPEFQVVGGLAADQWDRWNADRDQDLEKSVSGRYVNPDINGTEELDANGRWVTDPAYGQVWVPTVDPGWAPYQVGRWAWVDYYGWTWVSGDPWGWAPYHYGRWYQGSYGWAWWPGAMYGPYYWRPALVGFFGWGGGVGLGVGFGFGNVGWVALAPFERFHPWYGPGIYGRGFGSINIARNVNVANIYRNARVTNGVTSMSSNQFGRAGVNASTNIRAGSSDLARAGAVRGSVPISPSRESTHFSDRGASSAGMPRSSDNSRFFSKSSAASTNHVSFDQQRQAMSRSAATATRTPATSGSAPSSSMRGPSVGGSSGTPSAAPARTPSAPASPSTGAGWRSFNGNNSGSVNSGAGAARSASPSSQAPVRINPSVTQSRGGSSGSSSSAPRSSPAPSSGSSRGGSSGGGGSRGGGGGGGSHSGGGGGRR